MIEISGLTKRYGKHTVLDGIDLRVVQGQIAAIVGPSGAGKSTLARCINLLERPTSGSIRVSGQELTHHVDRHVRAVEQEQRPAAPLDLVIHVQIADRGRPGLHLGTGIWFSYPARMRRPRYALPGSRLKPSP